MKERLLESLAILLAGLFSAERPRSWQTLGAPSPCAPGASTDDDQANGREHPEN